MQGFDTQRIAAFIATRAELLAALPGWRVPLPRSDALIGVYGVGALLGEYLLSTSDPARGELAPVPAKLPFESVWLPRVEDWEERYAALDFALAGEPGLLKEEWDDLTVSFEQRRQLFEEPVVGANNGPDPFWVHVVPARMVDSLAALDDGSLEAVLDEWEERCERLACTTLNRLSDLRDLRSLARAAKAQGREMFMWMRHGTLR